MFDQVKRDHVVAHDNGFAIADIRADGLFLPGADPEASEMLLDRLWRQRQASLLAAWLTISQNRGTLAEESGFAAALDIYRRSPALDRRAVMEHPCMRIWLNRMTQLPRFDCVDRTAKDDLALNALLTDGARLLLLPRRRSGFTLQRFDVDPILAAAIPPSYSFDELATKQRRDITNPYPLAFANEVVAAGLRLIDDVWPEARLDFDKFVKIVVHLPDLESRSCSAARFAGAILLSSYYDNTLLAVAESLLHECGHQALYCVMELTPLISETRQRSFKLPWSGSERDAYGYFHASYIYLILALFFERVADSDHHASRRDALLRLAAIVEGLERALDDFADADFFTESGKAFFDRFARQAITVIERNRDRFSRSNPLEN